MSKQAEKIYRTVSELQLPVLRLFVSLHGEYLNTDRAAKIDQRPLGSLYCREWISYRPGYGFYLTKKGDAAYARMTGEYRKRMHPEQPFSHYFDPIAYQLREPKNKPRLVIHRGGRHKGAA